jgi:hypothetical protein
VQRIQRYLIRYTEENQAVEDVHDDMELMELAMEMAMDFQLSKEV